MTPDEIGAEGSLSFLSIGTKILLKDAMDQFIRTQGDYRTHYASNMASALRVFSENTIHLVLTEVDLDDGSAMRLVKTLGGDAVDDDLYVILAVEENTPELLAYAEEIEAHSVLVKPFAATDLKTQIDRYHAWKAMPKEPWRLLIEEAKLAIRDKRFRDAENHFKEAVDCAGGNPTPLYKSGMYYLGKPDFYAVAETLFKKAIEMKSNYVPAISALGSLYLAKHDLDKAEIALKRAHALSPLNPDRLLELVRVYIERTVETCKASLRIDLGNANARYTLGKLLAVQKDYIGAIRELERAMPTLNESQKKESQTFIALARKLGGLAK